VGLPQETVRSQLHQYKRAQACSHRQNTSTLNGVKVEGQIPLGICVFVSSQVQPPVAVTNLLAEAKAFNNLVVPIRVSPV
jgi:hypothetical protein